MEYWTEQRILNRRSSNGQETLKVMFIFLIYQKMQIKTILRYHLTPVRMSKIKNTNDSLCWRGCGVRCILIHCWWECKLVQPLWKSVWRFLRKFGINRPQDPAIPLLGIYPRDAQSYFKSICSTMFIATLFVIAITWKKT